MRTTMTLQEVVEKIKAYGVVLDPVWERGWGVFTPFLHNILGAIQGARRGQYKAPNGMWEVRELGAGFYRLRVWMDDDINNYRDFFINLNERGSKMKIEIINETPAFELSARDWNGQGEEVQITWSEIKSAPEGKKWTAYAGNTHRECVIADELEIVHKRKDGTILARRSWVEVGGYPDYPTTEEARYILFVPVKSEMPEVDDGIEIIKGVSIFIPEGKILAGSYEKPTIIHNEDEDIYYIINWLD